MKLRWELGRGGKERKEAKEDGIVCAKEMVDVLPSGSNLLAEAILFNNHSW